MRSIKDPDEFALNRKFWKECTIANYNQKASVKYIEIILSHCGSKTPFFYFITGGNAVRETNILPLYETAKELGFMGSVVNKIKNKQTINEKNSVFVGAHYVDLVGIEKGFKVHIDHDLKGIGTANIEYAKWDYKKNDYFPNIDLHIVAGKAGAMRTKLVLGPNHNRVVIGGYPKADHFIKYNTEDNRGSVYKELGLEIGKPLITYAPAGEESFMKPGGSLNGKVIKELHRLSVKYKYQYHILIKLKYERSIIKKAKSILKNIPGATKIIFDKGNTWTLLSSDILSD